VLLWILSCITFTVQYSAISDNLHIRVAHTNPKLVIYLSVWRLTHTSHLLAHG